MQIHVKLLPSDKVITLDVERDSLIESVRQRIEEKEGILPDQQRLFFERGEMLRNGYKLSDCGISSGTTLRLVVKGDGMLIYIKVLSVTCELVPLAVEPTDTVESVKWKYHAQEGILPDKQLLFFGSNELENERTLFYHGISDEARLELLLPMPSIPRTGQIQVLIRLLSNPPVFTLVVELTDTVINLKDKIHDIRGIPPIQQRLIVRGVQMEDVRMLWTYGLEKDVTIHLVLQLRGD